MNVFIAVDMEGVAGIVHSDQTRPHAPEWDQSRRLMTAEANAAVAGARAAGADRIVVADCHWDMRNILPELLDPAAELLQGAPRPLSMVDGLDASYDALILIGHHARAGTAEAVIDHTYTGSVFDVRVNGQSVGEIGLNAAYAGVLEVPLAFVSGDQQAVAEARALCGADLPAVIVKQALGQSAALALAPTVACERIAAGVEAALATRREPLRFSAPIRLEVEFLYTRQADVAAMLPGAERQGARTVSFEADSYQTVFRAWRCLFLLGNAQ